MDSQKAWNRLISILSCYQSIMLQRHQKVLPKILASLEKELSHPDKEPGEVGFEEVDESEL